MISNQNVPRLTPKRLKSDLGTDEIYPYYAGFSSRFAESMLRDLQLPAGAIVLDPWNGSGTTTTAASLLGLSAVGVDLNPFACEVARAKLVPKYHETRLLRVVAELSEQAKHFPTRASDNLDPLAAWLPPSAASHARLLVSAIRRRMRNEPPLRALLLVALARALRPHAIAQTKNPTWPIPSQRRGNARAVRVAFVEETARVIDLLSGQASATAQIEIADSRALPLASGSVAGMLTSPPYFTRIDYAAKTGFELALLHQRARGTLRYQLMGTTALRRPKANRIPDDWPSAIRSVLRQIRHHPSHRSAEYYFPNALQYFGDAIASMSEIARVLVPNAKALLVLQDSYYKELHIDLAALFIAIGRSLGLRGQILRAEPVRLVMTSINTASRKYLPKRTYVESVIQISKGAS